MARNTEKTHFAGRQAAWATGGYATANADIQRVLAGLAVANIERVNDAIIAESIRINDRLAPVARAQGIPPQNVFSIVAGFDGAGLPVAFANAPGINQFIRLRPGQFIGLGTITERVHQIASEEISKYPTFQPIPADQWAIRTMDVAVQEFPLSIGYPIDITMLNFGVAAERLRISNAREYRPSENWLLST